MLYSIRNHSVKGIAFDLEGTVIDLEDLHYEAHLKAAASAGVTLTTSQAVLTVPHFVGGPDGAVAEHIHRLSDGRMTMQDILCCKRRHYEQSIEALDNIVPRTGFLRFLTQVEEAELSVAIGSHTSRIFVDMLLKRTGLASRFSSELVVAREDVTDPKPHPAVYQETARRMHISSIAQLVFEDSIPGVSAAVNAGPTTIAVATMPTKSYLTELQKSGAFHTYTDWSDITIERILDLIGDRHAK